MLLEEALPKEPQFEFTGKTESTSAYPNEGKKKKHVILQTDISLAHLYHMFQTTIPQKPSHGVVILQGLAAAVVIRRAGWDLDFFTEL